MGDHHDANIFQLSASPREQRQEIVRRHDPDGAFRRSQHEQEADRD